MASGLSDVRVDTVAATRGKLVSLTIPSPSPQSSGIFSVENKSASDSSGPDPPKPLESSSPTAGKPSISTKVDVEALHRISPDSQIRCDSRECPIKDVKHNLGRYFHGGEQVLEDLEDSDFECPRASDTAALHQLFNFTIPPPDIVAAYLRTQGHEASQDDKDRIRQHQKHHTWSPISSETPSSRPQRPNDELQVVYANILPLESRETPEGDEKKATVVNATPNSVELNENGSSGEESPFFLKRRALCAADFDGTEIEDTEIEESGMEDMDVDDEDWLGANSDIHGSTIGFGNLRGLSIRDDQANEDKAGRRWSILPEATREVPQGAELVEVQCTLQQKILDQIAE